MTGISDLPPNLMSYFGDFVAHSRRQALRSAGGTAASALLAWALACCVADRIFQLAAPIRAGLLGAGLAAAAAIMFKPVRTMLRRRLDWLATAAEIERHDPAFSQRLLTVVSQVLGPARHRGSDDLVYRLLSDVERRAAACPPVRGTANRSVLLPWLAFGCLAAFWVGLTRVDALGLPRLAARFLIPFAGIEPVTSTHVTVAPGDTRLTQSQALSVEAKVYGLPEGGPVWLAWREEGGEWARRVMNRAAASPGGAAKFGLVLPGVERDLTYRVSAGDYNSREFTVSVLRAPAISQFQLRYVYPAYADRPPLTVTNADGLIEAPAGTEASLTITATEPLQSALLRVGAEKKVLMTRGPRDPPNVRRATFRVDRSGPYEIDLISTRDIAGGGPPGTWVRAMADHKPIVRLLNSGEGLRLNPRDVVPLSYQALDDFGIESLVARAQVASGPSVELPVPREGDSRRAEGTYNFDLAAIKLSIGDVVAISLVATDKAGQRETSDALQVLVAPRSVDLETHQRITEIEESAELAGLVTEELQATVKAFEDAAAHGGNDAEASSAASSRGNRFLTTATDTAVLVRQSVLRAVVRSRSVQLATALASVADSMQLVSSGAADAFRRNAIPGARAGMTEALKQLLDRSRSAGATLRAVAEGERSAAILADRENLAASQRRAASDPKAAERMRLTLERAREDVAEGVKGLGLKPDAANVEELLRAKVGAEEAAIKAVTPVDFVAAARDWSQELRRDPLRRLPFEDRLALAAQAEGIRPGGDLRYAHDMQLCSRASARIATDAASDKYAGRPISAEAAEQFVQAVAALGREHALNGRVAGTQPTEELEAARRQAAEARKLVARWAGEAATPSGASVAEARPRYRRTEDAAFRGGADLAARDYAGARAADRELLRQLSGVGPATTAASDPPPTATASPVASTPLYLRRDLDRVEHLTDRAETIDRVQSDQDKLAKETTASTGLASAPEAPALVDRQLDVAQRIEQVAAHDDPAAREPVPSIAAQNADDPNWRGRATAAVVKSQEQLTAMPQQLTRAQEEAAALRGAAERVEMARREAATAPADRRQSLERAVRQAESERADAERRFRDASLPLAPSAAEALAVRLAPFEPETAPARQLIEKDLTAALRDFERASLNNDPTAVEMAAGAVRQSIDSAQRELGAAQDEFTARDPLVAAKWFARAAADSLTRSPPDFQSAYRRQVDTSQALSRAWDRTVHEAAAQRLSLVPSIQPLYGVAIPPPVLPAEKTGTATNGAGAMPGMPLVREWGRLRTREVEQLNAPLRETEAPGFEKALQLYFDSLSHSGAESK